MKPSELVSRLRQKRTAVSAYDQRVSEEQKSYADQIHVHDLPPIASYWSNRYVRPMVEEFGFNMPEELFAKYLAVVAPTADGPSVFLSLGAGNCDTEVRTVQLMKDKGLTDFTIECMELNPRMLERGRALAEQAGVSDHLAFIEADFNAWTAGRQYKAVIANQVLHHVLELEHLFAEVKRALHPAGLFLTGDMIGRNGHQRWPEALEQVQRFWRELPAEYRWNRLLNRFEEEYINHDCSDEGFEGIRAQDILPLLLKDFDFHLFVPFANVIDPFVDRCFGHNFDANGAWDRGFIDRVHAFDEQAILDGTLTPTHMYAVLAPTPCREHLYSRGLAPERCVRREPAARGSKGRLRIVTPLLSPTQAGGASYSVTLSAAGGVPPYTWMGTELPPGFELTSEGALCGSIECDGEFTPLITVKDSSHPAQAVAQRYTILEKPRDSAFPLRILRAGELPAAAVGVTYKEALPAGGGKPPFEWSLSTGSLPLGLQLDRATGVISGEALATSRAEFRIRVQDAAGQSATADLALQTESPELAFSQVGLLSHLSCDADWSTEITLINTSPQARRAFIEIRSSRGKHIRGCLVPSPDPCACHESGHYSLPPYASLRIRVDPNLLSLDHKHDGPAWAQITANGAITGFGIYTYTSPQGVRSEVSVPIEQPAHAELTVPFDNENGNRTGLALLNASEARPDALVASIWDRTGEFLGTATIPLAGSRHTAFMVPEKFPVTAGRRGVATYRSLSGGPVLATCFCIRGNGVATFLRPIPIRPYGAALP